MYEPAYKLKINPYGFKVRAKKAQLLEEKPSKN